MAKIKEITGTGAEMAFQCTGSPKAASAIWKYVRRGGSILGSMGKRELGAGDAVGEEDDTKIYTDPMQAKDFAQATGIDALACLFGTTHGIYLTEPKLDFDVVANVRKNTDGIPVVMHGGSGVSREDYKKAIQTGVRKINYFTYMDKSGGLAVQEYINNLPLNEPAFFSSVSMAGRDSVKEKENSARKGVP